MDWVKIWFITGSVNCLYVFFSLTNIEKGKAKPQVVAPCILAVWWSLSEIKDWQIKKQHKSIREIILFNTKPVKHVVVSKCPLSFSSWPCCVYYLNRQSVCMYVRCQLFWGLSVFISEQSYSLNSLFVLLLIPSFLLPKSPGLKHYPGATASSNG